MADARTILRDLAEGVIILLPSPLWMIAETCRCLFQHLFVKTYVNLLHAFQAPLAEMLWPKISAAQQLWSSTVQDLVLRATHRYQSVEMVWSCSLPSHSLSLLLFQASLTEWQIWWPRERGCELLTRGCWHLPITAEWARSFNMADDDNFPLHASVFKDDKRKVSQLLRTHDASQKDTHGIAYNSMYYVPPHIE